MVVIGISGSYGGLNTGDEAILTSMLASLRGARPGECDEFVVFSRNADHTASHHCVDRVVPTRDLSRDQVLPEIERLDLFLLGGGGILYNGEARVYLRDVRLAQEREVPTFAYAVGVGPLDEAVDCDLVQTTLERMAGVTVRDELSRRVLEHVGLERRVDVTADPALLLEPDAFPPELLVHESVTEGRPLVGMSVREPGKAASDLDEHGYHDLLGQAADYAVYRFDADVVFLPIERDDIRHSHAVASRMVAAERVHVVKRLLEPRQMLGLVKHLDLVIGMRLHVLIFAALSATPFLPLPYAGKVTDFVAAAGVPAPAPVKRESAGPLLAAIDCTWDTREEQRRVLRERVPALREQAGRTVELALAALNQKASPDPCPR
ncbi:MAG: polysaccharide pyruvyl transferase family protein [Mycobacterium leprae]